jgi:(2Fe-2S) ferredoxin
VSKFQRHFFVCINERPSGGKGSCAPAGSREVLFALQEGLASHPELWSTVTVTPCGCLGPCLEGPSIVVYPEGVWYARVQKSDAPEIVREHMLGGRPVERLVYHWPDA